MMTTVCTKVHIAAKLSSDSHERCVRNICFELNFSQDELVHHIISKQKNNTKTLKTPFEGTNFKNIPTETM